MKGLSVVLCCFLLTACKKDLPEDTLFSLLDSKQTGISFQNKVIEDEHQNMILLEYTYNGAGVAAGDINNDGLPDLFFGGNQVSCRLYLNKGNLSFEDITENAGLITKGWATGVNMVDVNEDGLIDIYICLANKRITGITKNLLYINNGDLTFKESAESYGIADTADATHSIFFDYDKDGDLDMYLLNHTFENSNPSKLVPRRIHGEAQNTDKLFRNEGRGKDSGDQPVFTDVSHESGITFEGYGLGIAVSDFDQDGWPDIYVTNDYLSNDILYHNNGDGTFTNVINQWLTHQSMSSMGCDAADFNNDGYTDIFTLDMFAEDNFRQKMMFGRIYHDRRHLELETGYEPQYIRNMLHIHRGFSPKGEPYFSEIGQLAGVFQTDWSWSPLFADFDNDGLKDLFISNGLPKDITNLDLIRLKQQLMKSRNQTYQGFLQEARHFLDSIPGLIQSNYVFKNNGNLTFSDKSADWGIAVPGYSNGAIYSDLDRDGDLDIVTNNINMPVFIYNNNTIRDNGVIPDTANYLDVKILEKDAKTIGTKVRLFCDGSLQYLEIQPSRGYKSSTERLLHFGLGRIKHVDSVEISWPDNKKQIVKEIQVNSTIEISYNPGNIPQGPEKNESALFKNVTKELKLEYVHVDRYYNDYNVSPLLLNKFSQSGPGIAVGDVNGDHLEDMYIGGAYKAPGSFYLQNTDGTFKAEIFDAAEKDKEDLGCLLFDSDNDGDNDLYVVSGSSEYGPQSEYYSDRLYRNEGSGNFILDKGGIPEFQISGSCIEAADFDNDGDLDLFRGGRVALTKYPNPVPSYILENVDGNFKDVSRRVCPEMNKLGMVTDALWTDVNNDNKVDLVVVGEWMPLTIFINSGGQLVRSNQKYPTGWWNSITGGDFDNDGDIDLITGNFGLNSRLKANVPYPITIDAGDFNNDNVVDGIISHAIKSDQGGKDLFPLAFWGDMDRQISFFKRVYRNYSDYASTNTKTLLEELKLNPSIHMECNELASIYWENQNGKFKPYPLPLECQFAPLFGMVTGDFNDDEWLDVIVGGNFYSTEAMSGRYDAFYGALLLGTGKNSFNFIPAGESGIFMKGDIKGMGIIFDKADDLMILATRNNSTADLYRKNKIDSNDVFIVTPEGSDKYAELTLKDNSSRKVEFYFGSTYLSNSSRSFQINGQIQKVEIIDELSNKREIKIQLP